ncbi:MAG: NAD(P)-binding protein [Maricaulaceae bacterium]|nr:NAD(P)-binding protein [Maricaulaceae bacterium]
MATPKPAAAPSPRWIVAGGGLSGMVAAWRLVQAGAAPLLAEPSPRLGGVNNSKPWNGHQLDFGCHLFGNDDDATTALYLDMMNREAVPVAPKIASVTNGRLAADVEYPDLAAFDEAEAGAALLGLVEAAARDEAEPDGGDASLAAWLERRYGAAAARLAGRRPALSAAEMRRKAEAA